MICSTIGVASRHGDYGDSSNTRPVAGIPQVPQGDRRELRRAINAIMHQKSAAPAGRR